MVGRIVDVSSNDHLGGDPGQGTPIDWQAVKNNGVTTAIVKATEGTGYLQSLVPHRRCRGQGAGMQCSPTISPASVTPKAEAHISCRQRWPTGRGA